MNIISDIHVYIRRSRYGYHESDYTYRSKRYPRMPQIALDEPKPLAVSLADALQRRKSGTKASSQTLSRSKISQLFGHAVKARADYHRPYPSGGGFFPIETYILAFNMTGLSRDVFHYRPDTHALESLWQIPKDITMRDFSPQEHIAESAGLVIFTAVWQASAQKYKDFAYNLALLEAGHMCQNLVLVATDLAIGVRPLGGFADALAIETLDIDPRLEQPVYAAALFALDE